MVTGVLVVVVTHRSQNTLPTAWRSLLAQRHDLPERTADGCRIRIVDSASPDGTVALARRLVAQARSEGIDADVIALDHNVGYAAAINQARRDRLPGEAVVVMNPDVVLMDGCLNRLLVALDDPLVGIAVPRLLDGQGRTLRSRRRHPTLSRMLGEALWGDRWEQRPPWLAEVCRNDHDAERPCDVDWATGAVMAVGADCDQAVGDWDERYFLYGEEVDVARRAGALGFRVRYVPTAMACHAEGGSGRRPELTALATWNRLRALFWHRGPAPAAVGWCIAVLHSVLRWRRREQRVVLAWLLPFRRHPISVLVQNLSGQNLSAQNVSGPNLSGVS